MQKMDMTIPRCALLKRSAKTAGTTAIGLAANKPAKNRQIMRVWKSFPVAQPTVKIPHPKRPRDSGQRRPMSSEAGAQMVGPAAKPSTYSVTPSEPTSWLTWNSLLAEAMAAAKTALANEPAKVP
jgi:hypothetical protein